MRWSRSWNEALRRAKYRAAAKAVSVSASAVEYDVVSRARMVCTSGLHHVAHAAHGVDQLRLVPVIDLLAQPRDHDVHDVRPRIEMIIPGVLGDQRARDRKSTRLNSSHGYISYAVFCLKKKNNKET